MTSVEVDVICPELFQIPLGGWLGWSTTSSFVEKSSPKFNGPEKNTSPFCCCFMLLLFKVIRCSWGRFMKRFLKFPSGSDKNGNLVNTTTTPLNCIEQSFPYKKTPFDSLVKTKLSSAWKLARSQQEHLHAIFYLPPLMKTSHQKKRPKTVHAPRRNHREGHHLWTSDGINWWHALRCLEDDPFTAFLVGGSVSIAILYWYHI